MQHLNQTDKTGNIKVTVNKELAGKLPMQDAVIVRKKIEL